jgi:hypothetical protein
LNDSEQSSADLQLAAMMRFEVGTDAVDLQ